MENLQIKPRDISIITEEIRSIQRQANAMALLYAVEIGRRLEEAKSALPYGEWGKWLRDEIDFSQSTANNFMRLFEEYGSAQISIFGASVDSQTFANLPYSKALQLLAVPKEEREAFAEEVNAEDLSVKELKAAIDERDKQKKIAELEKRLKEEAQKKAEAAEEAARDALLKADEAEKLKNQLDEMQRAVEKEKQKTKKMAEKLSKAEKDPQIPEEKLKEIRKQAEEEAKKNAAEIADTALAEAKKKADDAQAEAIKAQFEAKQAKEELEAAKKKIKTSRPEIAEFKALYDDMQQKAIRLKSIIDRIGAEDPETAGKLNAAMKAFGAGL